MTDNQMELQEHTKDGRTVSERLDALEHDQDPLHGITKAAVKEAIKEWLDEQFVKVGKWTVHGIVAMSLAALVYFILLHNGWKHTP